jgi:hypothetical protein
VAFRSTLVAALGLLALSGRAEAAAVAAGVSPWPGAQIPVYVDPSIPRTDARYAKLGAAMRDWAAQSGVRFRLVAAPQASMLYVAPNRGSPRSCYATVGYRPQVTFEGRRFSGGYMVLGACSRGSVLHEFGHVLGLMHEHQRSDRDAYLDAGAVADILRKCGPGRPGCGEVGDSVARYPAPERLRTPYDPCSLMHYLADQSPKARAGRLPASPAWGRWYALTAQGRANARQCRATLAPVPGCGWAKTGQKCEISCQDANLVAEFHGVVARRACWPRAAPRAAQS